ncbi:MAG TPA: hydrogenase maturation protease [Acidimicrobiales bacterium]
MTAAPPRVLVAGIGNIFFSDDAFGLEVVARLMRRPVPDGVAVADFGIRGLHLAHELLYGYDTLVLVDALAHGEVPGTVTVLEIDTDPDGDAPVGPDDDDGHAEGVLDAHSIDPTVVLATLHQLGGDVGQALVVGCEPVTCAPGMGLSDEVDRAVDLALETIDPLLAELVSCPRQSEVAR